MFSHSARVSGQQRAKNERLSHTVYFARCYLNTVYAHVVKKRYASGKIIVVCVRTDTINSADPRNTSHIMTTPPNVTANATHYIEQVYCNEGTHELVYVALTLFIISLSALLASFLEVRRPRRSTTAYIERVTTTV